MERKKLIQSDGYWIGKIENALYHKNYKGKDRKQKFIKTVLSMKNEVIQLLNEETVNEVSNCRSTGAMPLFESFLKLFGYKPK